MTGKELHGRQVAWFYGSHDPYEGSQRATPDKNEQMVFEYEYLGDHSESWIVTYDIDGFDIRRFNAAHAESIEWKPTVTDAGGPAGE